MSRSQETVEFKKAYKPDNVVWILQQSQLVMFKNFIKIQEFHKNSESFLQLT